MNSLHRGLVSRGRSSSVGSVGRGGAPSPDGEWAQMEGSGLSLVGQVNDLGGDWGGFLQPVGGSFRGPGAPGLPSPGRNFFEGVGQLPLGDPSSGDPEGAGSEGGTSLDLFIPWPERAAAREQGLQVVSQQRAGGREVFSAQESRHAVLVPPSQVGPASSLVAALLGSSEDEDAGDRAVEGSALGQPGWARC